MRLIHSTTLELAEFTGSKIPPPYAILSHKWGEVEVSFEDMQDGVLRTWGQEIDSKREAACKKIKGCCDTAMKDGFSYVWIDTCCIDKTSSSELSEAINSMYRWYQQADVCYAYLSDVESGFDPVAFAKSKWFGRGWTLQELIAPSSLIFFNVDWEDIGTKFSRQEIIHGKTGIPPGLLSGLDDLKRFSIAQRMSWASKRETTKVEDRAYCLMGIFDINMPMLYGEGDRAFIRLQEEIIRTSDDQSILAWESDRWEDRAGGLLASSPAAFSKSGDIVRSNLQLQNNESFLLTGNGLRLQVPKVDVDDGEIIDPEIAPEYSFTGVLDCERMNWDGSHVLGIYLKTLPGTSQNFSRFDSTSLEKVEKSEACSAQLAKVYVRQERRQTEASLYNKCLFEISGGFSSKEIYPAEWDGEFPLVQSQKREIYGAVRFAHPDGMEFVLVHKWEGKSLSINIVEPVVKSETLQEIIWSFKKDPISGPQREWKESADRMSWQHPGWKWCICMKIKRRIDSDERLLVVNITCSKVTTTKLS